MIETGEEAWIEDARQILMRAAEGGAFRDAFRNWTDGNRSPFVARRSSEILGREIQPGDVKKFGIFDRHRTGWAGRFWRLIDASRLAAEREEAGA